MPGQAHPSDLLAPRFPISVKGVVEVRGQFVLLRNERDEWELPGGKLEVNERPDHCLAREILEELHIRVEVAALLDVWIYNVLGKVDVFIVTFGTQPIDGDADIRLSAEHKEVGLFSYGDIAALNMPAGYKASIASYRDAQRSFVHGDTEQSFMSATRTPSDPPTPRTRR
jgi:8-oxo-dGTP pyrophosphatase MutT (NUDIX family)